jgi:transketolase
MTQDLRSAFPDTILEVGKEDSNLVVLVGDIGHFALQPFAEACPGRYYNVGILEPTIISMAAGMASVGLYPVVHTIAPFLIERSFEQLKLDFCYQELGGTLMSVGSAFEYSTLGGTHHTYDDIALVRSLPGSEVIYPASPKELNLLFKQTYANGNLTYIRMTRQDHGVDFSDDKIQFGKGILVKEGCDITLIAAGPQLKNIMGSLELLSNAGIDAEILYYPTLKPFDAELARQSINKTKRVLTVEEHIELGGLGDQVLRAIQGIDGVSMDNLCIPDHFLRNYGTYQEHCEKLGFTPQNITNMALKLCNMNNSD